MRRPRLRLLLGLGIPFLVIVLLLTAWAIDSSSASGKVPRNVTLADRDISKFPEDELTATVADVAEQYAATEVQVRTKDQTYKVKAADLGLQLDIKATTRAALDLEKGTSLPGRPVAWLGSFLDEREAPLRFTVDPEALEQGLAALSGNEAAVEPAVVATAAGFNIVSGTPGQRIDAAGVGEQLLERAESGELPIVVQAEATQRDPVISDEAAQAFADKLTASTAEGLTVTAGTRTAAIPAQTVRSWIGTEVKDGALAITLDAEKASKGLATAFPPTTEAKDASFTVENGAVKLIPSVNAEACCAADTSERVRAAIIAGESAVEIKLEVTEPEFTTEEAEKLGIKEPVGSTTEWNGQPQVKSFTTYYQPGQPRVTNIRRIAELVRGTLVKPGETFSMNAVVGQRTAEKGFVEAGAIANGEHVDEVGGGVSQFATTMFNAVFFAGLDFEVYQAHSEYFSRYPYGREATMGFPNPDLAWKNDTPYGILVWTSSTETSVTVTLYSTQHATAAQTGQTTGRSGNCTTVSTERTITFPDGTTKVDTVGARYRDAGKTTC